MRLCSISVDLDEIDCYCQIHGVGSLESSHAVYDVALPRIDAMAEELGIPLTLFVVARDLRRAESALGLARVLRKGHELGNHTLDHLYDLTRRDITEQREQVEGANALFSEVLGVRPSGFRAPGYTVSDQLLTVVRDCGMSYDSSVFPSPPYYAAKTAALLAVRARGTSSNSVLDSPKVLRAPCSPYHIGEPYWTTGTGLLELPIQVASPMRFPFIGTTLTLLGASAARLLTRTVIGRAFVNLELHGIDFLDAGDVPRILERVQPDLKVPWPRKREALSAVLQLLRASGYGFVRLDEAARAFT